MQFAFPVLSSWGDMFWAGGASFLHPTLPMDLGRQGRRCCSRQGTKSPLHNCLGAFAQAGAGGNASILGKSCNPSLGNGCNPTFGVPGAPVTWATLTFSSLTHGAGIPPARRWPPALCVPCVTTQHLNISNGLLIPTSPPCHCCSQPSHPAHLSLLTPAWA